LKKYENKGRTKTRTKVEVDTDQAARGSNLSTLTPQEEKVIRMLHGLSEDDTRALEFAVGASKDARQRLALMEAYNIAELEGNIPLDSNATSKAALDGIVEQFQGRD